MRLLHAADLHLGLRITRFDKRTNDRVREARFEALDNLVNVAKLREVDAVLIAGDLFDDNHVELDTRRRALELLEKIKKPVYVLPGNHDPLTADSVWERPPWNSLNDSNVRVLRERMPMELLAGVTLWPCPLVAKTSLHDPTHWLPPRSPGDGSLRIGIAHGSLKDRPQLPEDDHLIARDVADAKGLDYLALGHWHKKYLAADAGGVTRIAYPGTHEPMRFRSGDFQSGWSAYSNAQRDLFEDDGHGMALLVTLTGHDAPPQMEALELGCLHWHEESHELRHEDELSRLIDDLANRPMRERTLLRLRLQGVLSAKALLRLDELANPDGGGVLSRFCWGELLPQQLHAEPTDEEVRELTGSAVLRRVYDQLRTEGQSADPKQCERADESLKVLYRLAQGCA